MKIEDIPAANRHVPSGGGREESAPRFLDVPRWTLPLSVVLFLWGIYWQLFSLAVMASFSFLDFGRFYYAVINWRVWGDSLYDPSVATWLQLEREGVHLWNLNPPHVSLLFWPLTYWSIQAAHDVWTILTIWCLSVSAFIIVRTLHIRLSVSARLLLVAFVVSATPTLAYACNGQVTGPMTLLSTWIWRQLRSERWMQAAVGVGLAWSTKVFLLPLLGYLLFTRRFKAAGVALLTGTICFMVGLAVFGWQEHVRWIQALRGVQWPWLVMNASVVGPFSRAAYTAGGGAITNDLMPLATHVGVGVAAIVGLVGFAVAVRDRQRDRSYFVLLSTILLAGPLGWLYYWWMFAAPLAACLLRDRWVRVAFCLSLPGWLVPMWFLWPFETTALAVTWASIYCWSLLILWGVTLIRSLRDASQDVIG